MLSPTLKSKRITLCLIKLSDAEMFLRWLKDKKVTIYLMTQKVGSVAEEKKWIKETLKSNNRMVYTIINENGRPIGNTGLELHKNDKTATFGIMIGEKDEWGKGYAGEVIKLLANYLFKKLKYNRFDLVVASENKRAILAYEKAGFVKEGVRRQAKWNAITKKFEDDIIMSILREDWLLLPR